MDDRGMTVSGSVIERTGLAPSSTLMFAEAGDAAAVVARQLDANAEQVAKIGARLRAAPPRAVVTAARGSSDHAATFAKYLIETGAGVVTASAALSVNSLYGAAPKLDGTLYLAISQSGRSPDLLQSVEAAKATGAFTVALVNDATSPLAALADEVLPLLAGPELSVAATKSYIAALTAIVQLTAAWTQDAGLTAALRALPEHLRRAWALDWSFGVERLAPARNLYVLGRGMGFAVAQEAALKLKETCNLHAEAFSTAEVSHGPMAIVRAGFPMLLFAQDDAARAGLDQTAREMTARGGEVLTAATGAPGPGRLPAIAADPRLQPILMIQSFYRMANALAVARGYDPDRPPHLNKVTQTL